MDAGVTAIDDSVAPVTVKAAVPDTPPNVALMFVVPAATPVAMPLAEIVAAEVVWEAHATLVVITCVVPSLKVPVAVKPSLVPGAMERPVGVTVMEVTVAVLTVNVTDDVVVPTVAVIVVVPAVRALASPLLMPIVATPVFEDVQVACPVKFFVLPSLKVPNAENCCVVFAAT